MCLETDRLSDPPANGNCRRADKSARLRRDVVVVSPGWPWLVGVASRVGGARDARRDLLNRAATASDQTADIAARSNTVLSRLSLLTGREDSAPPPATEATAAAPSAQMRRRHVVLVNSDPAFLDAARVLLQGDRYNVTTTNLVPATYDMIHAAGADALVVDLKLGQPQIW